MKQKLFLLAILLTGLFFNIYAQEETDEKASVEKRERTRAVPRVSADVRPAIRSTGEFGMIMNEKRVSLNLSKKFMGETVSSKADFEVAKGQSAISLNLSGSCRKGTIKISIILPGGGTLEELTITTAADVHWSATIPIKEGDEGKYIGKWKLEVNANNTEGEYNLNISSR